MAFKFAVTLTTDVPVIRTSTALPMPWAEMVAAFEAKGRKKEELPNIVVPKSFWTEDRGIKETDTAEYKGKDADGKEVTEQRKVLTADNMGARLKASFVGFRAGLEKQDGGKLKPFRVGIEEQHDTEGNWTGHRVVMMPDDIEAREEAIKRGKALAAKNKKKAPKKAAAK